MSGRDTIPSSAIDLIGWGGPGSSRRDVRGATAEPWRPSTTRFTQRQRERYSFVKTFVTSIVASISFMSINAFCIASQPAFVE